MEQLVEKVVVLEADEGEKTYTVDVIINEGYLEASDERIVIYMRPVQNKDGSVSSFSFGSNHDVVREELHIALDHFQLWINQKLHNNKIITKLQELDRM